MIKRFFVNSFKIKKLILLFLISLDMSFHILTPLYLMDLCNLFERNLAIWSWYFFGEALVIL